MSTGGVASMELMFRKNAQINTVLLETLSADDLMMQDERGGESIFYLLAHMAHFRHGWVSDLAPEHLGESVPTMQRQSDGSARVVIQNFSELQNAFRAGDKAMLSAVAAAVARGSGWQGHYPDPTMILARTVTHDAHHRGQIKTILRLHGVNYPHLNWAFFGAWGEP